MTGARLRRLADDHVRAAMVATGLLAVAGLTCVGVAIAQHRSTQPPQPSLSSGRSIPAPSTAPSTPAPRGTAAAVVGPVLKASVPISLSIPAIRVKTRLQKLGQAADGTAQVPAPGKHYDEAGWYRYSPTPGVLGPSVIIGHVDSAAGPSVFWRLGSLRPRDTVRIKRADGSVAVFVVDDVRRFRKSQFPSRLVYGNTNHAALRLITCGGPLQGGHYRDNIVVRASLVRAHI